jgi:hypothetical protein
MAGPPREPQEPQQPGPRQAPQIIDRSIDLSFTSEYDSHGNLLSLPELQLWFLGDIKRDDRVLLQYASEGHPIGDVIDCAVKPSESYFATEERPSRPTGKLECGATPARVSLPGPGAYDIELIYRMTAEGTEVKWRHIAFEAEAVYYLNRRYLDVNRDRDLYGGWITQIGRRGLDTHCQGISTLDLSVLVSPARPTKQSAGPVVVGRCYVGGRQIGGDQTNIAYDRNHSITNERSKEVVQYDSVRILTGFVHVPPHELKCLTKANENFDNYIAKHPGPWECKITIDGQLARVVHFTVDANGQIPLHPEQIGDGALVWADHNTRFVDVEVVGDFDRELARRRIGGSAFFGRPWKTPRLRAVRPDAPSPPAAVAVETAPQAPADPPPRDRAVQGSATASEADRSSADLEAAIATTTKGLKPDGPPLKGKLEAFQPVKFRAVRGRCYAVALRLQSSARWSDHARQRVEFRIYDGDIEDGDGPGMVGPGGTTKAVLCPQKTHMELFDVHTSSGHDLGQGDYTLQLYSGPISEAKLREQQEVLDRGAKEAAERDDRERACSTCRANHADCVVRQFSSRSSCDADFRSCAARAGVYNECH